jgi:GMP synthase (glutamine-hydrolysing)
MLTNNVIVVLDFGSQYTQLISRRIREKNVLSLILPFYKDIEEINKLNPKGIILSGGPTSVYDANSPQIDKEIFELGIPVLGICYGMQLIAHYFGGKVEPASNREYGKAHIEFVEQNVLFENVKNKSTVWMSHGDLITKIPDGFIVDSKTNNSPICSISNKKNKLGLINPKSDEVKKWIENI